MKSCKFHQLLMWRALTTISYSQGANQFLLYEGLTWEFKHVFLMWLISAWPARILTTWSSTLKLSPYVRIGRSSLLLLMLSIVSSWTYIFSYIHCLQSVSDWMARCLYINQWHGSIHRPVKVVSYISTS